MLFAQEFDLKAVKIKTFHKMLLRKARAAETVDLIGMLVQPDGARNIQRVANVAQRVLRCIGIIPVDLYNNIPPDAVFLSQNTPKSCHILCSCLPVQTM